MLMYLFLLKMSLFFIVAIVVAALLYVINVLVYSSIRTNNSATQLTTTYECGFEALLNQSRHKHTIAYYLVALLYLIFDLEIALILPAVVSLVAIGSVGTILLLVVMTLLCFCFIYELQLNIFQAITQEAALVKVVASNTNNSKLLS